MPNMIQAAGEAMAAHQHGRCPAGSLERSVRRQDDGYQPVIVHLAPRWRVIVCRDGIQWIVQHRASSEIARRTEWKGVKYLRTRSGLIAACERSLPKIDPSALAILHTLPDHIEDGARPMRKSIVDQREAKAGEERI